MAPEASLPKKKLPIVPLAALAVAAVVAVVLVLRGVNLHGIVDEAMGRLRAAGPWVFFLAVVVLPAIGAPLSAFTLTAGEAFSSLMTMPGVIAATLAALALNQALTYWMVHHGLRPLVTRLAARYGYSIPKVSKENALSVALVVRLTPGPPYFVQGYILALAEVPFRLYMIVSWLAVVPWAVGAIVLGKGVFKGDFKLVAVGIGVIAVATALVHYLRSRYAARTRKE